VGHGEKSHRAGESLRPAVTALRGPPTAPACISSPSSTRSPIERQVYVGQDRTNTLTYFGSVDSRLVEHDFSPEQRRDFTVRKEILWESATASQSEVTRVEIEFIRALRSNDPAIGYNRWPAATDADPMTSRGGHTGPAA